MKLLGLLLVLPLLHLSLPPISCENASSELSPCPPNLSIGIPEDEDGQVFRHPDGSLAFGEHLYPPGTHWHDGNGTRGCICEVAPKPCLRKCCPLGEIVSDALHKQKCVKATDQRAIEGGLILERERASPRLREKLLEAADLGAWFTLIESPECDSDHVFMDLRPEQFPEDAYELHENGSLWLPVVGLLRVGRFCVDHEVGRGEGLVVLACLEKVSSTVEEAPWAVRIGYMLSVPFLAVTFLVYVIIPELRNIYGKTLMCYVLSLLVAYSSISCSHFFLYGIGCLYIDKCSDDNCGDHEVFKECGPSCETTCDSLFNGETRICTKQCVRGCFCTGCYVRDDTTKKCICPQECPQVKH